MGVNKFSRSGKRILSYRTIIRGTSRLRNFHTIYHYLAISVNVEEHLCSYFATRWSYFLSALLDWRIIRRGGAKMRLGAK